MRLNWALNRLRTMEPAEILHRINERARQLSAKNRCEGWERYSSQGKAPNLPGLRDYVLALGETRRDASVRDASKFLGGSYAALGQTWPARSPDKLFPETFWRLDPATQELWPGAETYCFEIPYRHEAMRGDIKYVWEVNRLQFLQPLALTARFDGHQPALAAIEACIESWHSANPPFRGVAWNSGIEIALRAISLLVVSSLVGKQLSQPSINKLRAILAASLFWLRRFPSRFSSANNHLIAEATGEYMIALALPEIAEAKGVAQVARQTLETEALKQFLADGTPAEQSPSYGAFSAELLHTAHCTAPLDENTLHRLIKFADFIFVLDNGSGQLPRIGDDDEGLVLNLRSKDNNYPLDIAARLSSPQAFLGMKTFPQGGYTLVKSARWHVVFDHGPLGYLSIAAHGHADALSLLLSLDGRPIFVDPGTYLYHSGGNWRDWFRGTLAHNTLSIAGINQSRIAGPFNWLKKAETVLERREPGENWRLAANHKGYRQQFGVTHRRTLRNEPTALVICDELTGSDTPLQADIAFQLSPDLETKLEGNKCLISSKGRELAKLEFSPDGTVQVFYGQQPEAGGGWVSPAFGVKVAAPRLVWSGPVSKSGVTTRIQSI